MKLRRFNESLTRKFKVTFTHTLEEQYEAFVDAEDKDEARSIVREDPFQYVDGDEIESSNNLFNSIQLFFSYSFNIFTF